ncbi:hypothetical protein LTR70_005003 [Exophiala xenobiotica]|uniref:Altered inheritance of mitochondria protein 6 n=1 Tax=Lithohypha guttulata TaxID=1690604 RepID=A0ABR0KC54_9EURO|nr:hypothetical protein LTR24_004407 [Lithohypha guttulata]KAK5319384.1 hypothetical protein LTR70_005003 [Exophiala xenobiotica]
MKTTFVAAALAALATLTLAKPISRPHKRQSQRDPNLDISSGLQNILDNTHGSDLYAYPTDLTRGILPKAIHSHNDYWRDVPFYSALSFGCVSIEADVWLYNDTLHVGHEQAALTQSRTFDSLYIQPILSVLQRENPTSAFQTSNTHNGVFDASAGQTLYLFVDLKTDGAETFPYVVRALEPLRSAGYLTSYNGTHVTEGAVTVIGTGNTPLDQIAPVANRDYFFDANLALLSTTQANITSEISPIASTQFTRYIGQINGTEFNATQLQTLESQLQVAKERGIGGRYWDTPAWPVSTRNAVWTELVRAGVALLNADDLAAAAGFTSNW